MTLFETETMADLCLRQGHLDEALAIYRRLLERSAEAATRERIARRITAIEQRAPAAAAPPPRVQLPLAIPGVRARRHGDELTVEWRLPPETEAPALELLLVTRAPSGVATETRALALDGTAGRLVLEVAGLHSARAAAGQRRGGRFVPLARTS